MVPALVTTLASPELASPVIEEGGPSLGDCMVVVWCLYGGTKVRSPELGPPNRNRKRFQGWEMSRTPRDTPEPSTQA